MEARTSRYSAKALARLNEFRRRLQLATVELDERLSRACVKQGQYVDLVRGEGEQSWKFKGAATPHEAVRGLPGYSPAGALGGMTSVVAFSTPEECVKGWMASFFHRIPLINPDARRVGIGYVRPSDLWTKGEIALLSVPAIHQEASRRSVVIYPESGASGIWLNYGVETPDAVPNPEKKDDRGLSLAGFPVTVTFFGYDRISEASGKLFAAQGDGWEELPIYLSTPETPDFPAWPVLQGARRIHPEGLEVLDRLPHILRAEPPGDDDVITSGQGLRHPPIEPLPRAPRAFALCASSRNRSASYSSNAPREAALFTRSAFITLTPPSRTAVTASGVSSPWSCARSSPASREILKTSPGSSFTKTPTLMTFSGSAMEILRASSTPTRRGLSAKMNPTASAPAFAATRASPAFVMPHILTSVMVRSVLLIFGGESPGAPVGILRIRKVLARYW